MPIDDALIARAKAELRKRLRALRHTTPASACAKRSERIVERLSALDVMTRATRIALFWPIEERHEVDLRALDTSLRARNAEIAYPSLDELNVMTFRTSTVSDLVDDDLGFRGAPRTAPEMSPEVIVVPAIALAADGHRLGYGAGFYDRALTQHPSAIKIGVAYDFQLLVEVPSFPHDVAMNLVVTDARVIVV
jgi:5-formyltetrahydrofolate cyclo-ligase